MYTYQMTRCINYPIRFTVTDDVMVEHDGRVDIYIFNFRLDEWNTCWFILAV